MPFKKVYVVNFRNGNLRPSINTLGWPDMEFLAPSPPPQSDNGGIIFETRDSTGLFVSPAPGTLPIQSRILVELTFDRPTEAEAVPDLWAAWLSLANDSDSLVGAESVNSTCQFNRQRPPTGVRLNTPGSLEKPRPGTTDIADQAAYLDSPLDLARYQGATPSVFTLSLSFCGVKAGILLHTSGNTTLRIKDKNKPPRDDQRAYTSANLSQGTSIGVLGAGIELAAGSGLVSARLRTFSVKVNNPL